ncbi:MULTISPECIES: L,D-transpeptidase family protein [unclassified Bradyrhizobium]|uniref:L,D-transpeptidase family protein n=1 Tax=unclassified Bradyrhizobium TaxID=2631580 RepID=UPI0028EF5E31|nr:MULTISPECIES: L,D-transpeptidase family protein [unclassified Bradyrhizobium]
MINRAFVRVLMTSAALAAGALLTGCNSDQVALATSAKANQPVPPKLVATINEKDMDTQSPILVRVFKQEAELEVWKQDRSGKFALLKTYPICRWSGDLGPKVREGDRQAPEGFYSINPSQMNPQSAYYLSFNTGYPNAFDKALGRTGSQLMVHGDCSSRGCFAMTDEQIAEIYALGRESFFGGQRAFQFQAYPFRMTPVNMARHRNNPNMPFWRMIKEGYDAFEVTRQEPKVDFCEKKYVFNAQKPPGATRDLVFDAAAKCPAYVVPDEITTAVREKQQADEAEYAKLVAKGTPVAKLNTGIDGGMNPVFANRVPGASTGLSDSGEAPGLSLANFSPAPGTIPGHVNPPRAPGADEVAAIPASAAPAPVAAPATRVAAVAAPEKPSFMSSLARKVGIGGANETTATTKPTESKTAEAKPAPKPVAVAKPAETKPAETKQAAARPPFKPAAASAPAATASAPVQTQTALVSGAVPVLQSNSFDSRFAGFK